MWFGKEWDDGLWLVGRLGGLCQNFSGLVWGLDGLQAPAGGGCLSQGGIVCVL